MRINLKAKTFIFGLSGLLISACSDQNKTEIPSFSAENKQPESGLTIQTLDFESNDLSAWQFESTSNLNVSTEAYKTGNTSLKVSGLNESAVMLDTSNSFTNGYEYTISAWVKASSTEIDEINLALNLIDEAGPREKLIAQHVFDQVSAKPLTLTAVNSQNSGNEWVLIQGHYQHLLFGQLKSSEIVFKVLGGDGQNLEYFIDDLSFTAGKVSISDDSSGGD
ncbi:carbohydrate binding domain-containing protein, partial [Catenovulum maritimum]